MRAEKKGAFDYLPKPFDLDELLNLVSKTFYSNSANQKNILSTEYNKKPLSIYDSGPIIGKSSVMQDIYKTMSRLVSTNLTVLISGESGTGKKLIAKGIHDLSKKNNRAFIKLNMDFFNNSFFLDRNSLNINNNISGNMKTINDLNDCTILINEVCESTLHQQSNLLNFLENDFIELSNNILDFKKPRIITSTRKNIVDLVNKSLFREDLYYRLNVVPIKLPPLKNRPEDIPELSIYFLKNHQNINGNKKSISYDGMLLLKQYLWPGNIREFKNVIDRSCLLSSSDEISSRLISDILSEEKDFLYDNEEQHIDLFFKKYIKNYFESFDESLDVSDLYDYFISKVEKPLIESTLNLFRGNQIKASKSLGFNRNTLRKKINLYGINIIKKRKV
jgi:two-component system nitrogen regulation response regulator GlnG